MKRSQKLCAPFKALAAKVSAFGKLATRLARAARKSEDRGQREAARQQAKQLELYAFWMLSELTKDLERLEDTASPKGAEERRDRDYALAMLSVFFLFIKIARDIQERCADDGILRETHAMPPRLKCARPPIYDIPILDPG